MRRLKLIPWMLLILIGAALACNLPFDLTPPSLLATATATPTQTLTPTPTSTPTPTPAPTLTPTPNPAAWLSDGARVMQNGDYGAAAEIYRDLLILPLDDDAAARARLGLGAATLRDGDYSSAVEAFRDFLALHPENDQSPDAHFLLADALAGAGEPLAAAGEYRAYLSTGTVITPYVNLSLGDALYAGGAYTTAAQAYTAAIGAAPDRAFEVSTREKLALVRVARQDYAAAVAQYDAILEVAQIRAYRARIEHQAAETLILAGETEAGYDRHLTVVETYPDEYYAYLSLVELVEAGRPPDDFLRGVVDYYGGAYGPAVEAFYRYINAYPETHSGDAHWYAGLSYLFAGSPNLAAGEFQMLIETHPENAHVGDGWMGLAQAYAGQGQIEEAIATYRQFVGIAPDHRRAPEALWEAAQLWEDLGDREAAAAAYLDCQAQYPASDYGPQALFRGGLQFYQLGELEDAAAAWETLVGAYPDSAYRPAALLWLGKLRLAQGDAEAASTAFVESREADPLGYYGLRSADLSADPLSSSFPPAGYEPEFDAAAGRAEAEAWLAEWLGLEVAADLGELPPHLAAAPRMQRGLELWRLGRFEQAKWELEDLRHAAASDGLAQYQLALTFRDIGLYRSSILCAVRVIYLSPVTRTLDAPAFVTRLAYPTY
ncbi:MAG: tetratricopeptide repeat protein, partial [Chloroflexota bacterium]|nr:tetratricopeptide repeat protein [Chloroflexota bacterium]